MVKFKYLIYFLLILLCSCSTTKKITDNSQYDITRLDSIKEVYIHDTVYIEINKLSLDSIRKEIESQTDLVIQFVDSGGSINLNTGEATGVKTVGKKEKIISLESEVNKLLEDIKLKEETITSLKDSISNLLDHSKMSVKTEDSKKSLWWAWFLGGMGIMFIGIIVLRRIPQTKWLVFWI